ncbi:major facilitator superfamily domain-containing protein [Podospora didyma]|uniref:Major facilitator superfamily domain-containing protein n=1 Tax=Podospora didyma TaxID=330526 RepID=A0AAE0P4B6_9PEZI|nr:major facilitator superfamily domain-containing protein [Podospora didyma]
MRFYTLHELDTTEGTVQLRKAANDAGSDASSLVLVPRPSQNDPNDPLRWPLWKKHVAFLSVCSFTFLTNYGIGGLSPAFYILSLEFDKTVSETSDLLLWPILVLGVFNFFWVPVANYFGKRPVFVVASGLLCVSLLWGAVSTSFESLLWSQIIGAFAGSSTEALGASIVNDLYFLHERGAKMGLYMGFISGGNTIGPLICGFVITSLSWRWHKWIAVILTAINFLTILFLVPETRYYRDESQNIAGGESGPSTMASSSRDDIEATAEQLEKVSDTPEGGRGENSTKADMANDGAALSAIPKKTMIQDLSPWSGLDPNINLLKMFLRPLPMFAYPCVIYAYLGYAVSLVLTVAVNILNPFVLQAPPYSWSPMINGLINIPGLIGNLAGSFAGGWLVDMFCDWRTRRNKGVFEPENRLYMCVLPLLITGAGCVLFGYGVQNALHWTSLFFGYGMVSFALTAVPTITMAYVSDCVLPVNSDALMLVNGSKNIVAFGFLYGIIPWVDEAGYVGCFGAQAGIFVAIIAIGMALLIPLGGKIRHKQARWRIIM